MSSTSIYGVSHLPIIPLRKEADDRSEMISQVLFGEHFTVLDTLPKWLYIELLADSYRGWIDRKQGVLISYDEWEQFKKSKKVFATNLFNKITAPEGNLYIPLGSVLPFYKEKRFKIAQTTFLFSDARKELNFTEDNFRYIVYLFLNTPYLWGGKSVFGIDCSGFTQVVFSLFGVSLLRDAYLQASQGKLVPFLEQSKMGDLAFFENADARITHVGIMLSNNEIIHAHGKVRIDVIDQQGIYNKELQKYTHKLRMVKRYF